jgi:hypothetical protein
VEGAEGEAVGPEFDEGEADFDGGEIDIPPLWWYFVYRSLKGGSCVREKD